MREIRATLERAWRELEASEAADSVAAEWLLDNAYLIAEAMEVARESLPTSFVRWLPLLDHGDGKPRALALAEALLELLDQYVDPNRLPYLLRAYQERTPLSTAELWALPALLRLVVLRLLADEAAALAPGGTPATPSARESDPDAGLRIGKLVESVRALAVHDWRAYFEAASPVEAVLRLDPASVYARMDFETRDRYRKVVELLSRRGRVGEIQVAREAVALARECDDPERPEAHVGYYLIDLGRRRLEVRVGFAVPLRLALARLIQHAAVVLYLTTVGLTSAVLAFLIAARAGVAGDLALAAAFTLALVPASAVAVAFTNWLATRVVKPRPLPKLELDDVRASGYPAIVVVPALLTGPADTHALVAQLERNYHANADAGLRFALLTDFADARQEHMPADADLLRLAEFEIRELNRRHTLKSGGRRRPRAASGQLNASDDSVHAWPDHDADGPFLLVHRGRRWNPAERCWMGWERKRGKLTQFNSLVLGESNDLQVRVGDVSVLRVMRYAITLDADTLLPPEAASRLVGAAAHPLNQPRFDARGRVVRGYTVLQPRVEVILPDRPASAFARIFEGDRGLDLYSRAVSDAYQDLFSEGSYAGKGLYDIAAFERSVEGRIPENALLSHDLFEGAHGRAALVSDVAVFEDYPHHVLAYVRRLHRWIRGDWQIMPWLLPRVRGSVGFTRNRLSVLNRWKIADNLRRSLLEPSLVALLLAGWLLLPGSAIWWTAWAVAVPGLSFVLGTLAAARRRIRVPRRWVDLPAAAAAMFTELKRWLLSIVLLPLRALVALDAIVRTLGRLVARRRLLEWTSAASVARAVREATLREVWRHARPVPVFAALLTLVVALVRPASLPIAAPFAVAWLLSPWIAWRVSRPGVEPRGPIDPQDAASARSIARKTWSFFEAILRPEDHWLPVDNVQVAPPARVARRTSPTNIGLGAAATMAAWDFGYLTVSRLSAFLLNMFDSLDRLERYRGHFLNWYDTQTLASLRPRYVSTVDSGNLASALIAVARGCDAIPDERLPRAAEIHGLHDTLLLLEEAISQPGMRAAPGARALEQAVRTTIDMVPGPATPTSVACDAVGRIADNELPRVQRLAADLVEGEGGGFDANEIDWLQTALARARQHASLCRNEHLELMPWLDTARTAPGAFDNLPVALLESWRELLARLPTHTTLREVPDTVSDLRLSLRAFEEDLNAHASGDERARAWLADFTARMEGAATNALERTLELVAIAERADAFVAAMDFRFLYDDDRHLFHIGYDVDAGRADRSYYDLLASEARLASYLAIATGAVPAEHWLHLGRPFARSGRDALMKSWAGTMFEYLLPPLFLRTPDTTLLSFACGSAIREQRVQGFRSGLPWGVSESAYAQVDRQGDYQYRAFGVQTLALRRETVLRNVVAPYASALALPMRPREVMRNLGQITQLGGLGRFGFFDAIDFGHATRAIEAHGTVVRSHMAHHQAMILIAIDNALHSDIMVRRFHADARVAAVEHLVLERLPGEARIEPLPMPVTHKPKRASRLVHAALWRIEPDRERAQVQVLSNGRLSTLVSDRGAGSLRWMGAGLTRWRADPALDETGSWIYLQDLESGNLWMPTAGPAGAEQERYEVLFGPHVVEYRCAEHGIAARLSVCVAPSADVEIRRLTLGNRSERSRRIAVTSYAEVVLGSHTEDRRHQAFNKLFVEAQWHTEHRALLFSRRHQADGRALYLAHTVVGDDIQSDSIRWETDRARFIGRTGSLRRPDALQAGPSGLSGTQGASLDPIMAIGSVVELPAGAETSVTFVTAAAATGAAALDRVEAFRSPMRAAWSIREARDAKAVELSAARMSETDARLAQRMLSAIVYPYHPLRSEAQHTGPPRQNTLWGLGISGDIPIIAVRVTSADITAGLSRVLRAHAFLRSQQVQADLLVLGHAPASGGYAEPLANWLRSEVEEVYGMGAWHQTGGVFHAAVARLGSAAAATVSAAAALVLDAESDVLRRLEETRAAPVRLPLFEPVPSSPIEPLDTEPNPPRRDLWPDNGFGGFTRDGREYVVRVDPGSATPAPWINVIANPRFGFTVSERGGGFTWAHDSGRCRLTPWGNDPVLDAPGEVLYVRDEETGDVWSATPAPAPADARYEVRHAAGVTTFLQRSHGLEQRLHCFVPVDDTVKIVSIEFTNLWPRQRRLTATYYAELVLGAERDISAPHIRTELAPEVDAVLAHQRFAADRLDQVTFLAASETLHGATGDRAEFLGRGGMPFPDGLARIGLGERFGSGLDPCAATQVHIDIGPGEARVIHFLLGVADDRDAAIACLQAYGSADDVARARAEVDRFWDDQLGVIHVATPDPEMDVMLNRWLPYQALACRVWGRSALYQSSGAFGFRDQLQDVLAFLMSKPDLVRGQILASAARQFEEGDVLHWWHADTMTGVRTRCSDDLLWLPFVTAAYVESTGDWDILEERVPFLKAPPLAAGEPERYTSYSAGQAAFSLYEHCQRAIAHGNTMGERGLPLIGAYDWNDGFDRVGSQGRGESVWLGWFLHATLTAFSPLARRIEGENAAETMLTQAERLRSAIEAVAWDGDWYRRAYYDDGSPLGSASNGEARIDSISQSWAVLSGAAAPGRAARAMQSVARELLDEDNRLFRLLTPPFDRGQQQPGYIKSYPPGVRENGAQYTHAAVWAAWAMAQFARVNALGPVDATAAAGGANPADFASVSGEARPSAVDLFRLLNPITHSDAPDRAVRYRVEPYVVAADIYSEPPHAGRGGWTWYTGSAGWLYRFGLECVLGFQRRGNLLYIDPIVPADWHGFTIRFRHVSAEYHISVENPNGEYEGVEKVIVDGGALDGIAIPLTTTGTHQVVVRLGARTGRRPWSTVLW